MLGIDVSKKSKKKKRNVAIQRKEKRKVWDFFFFLSSPDRPLPFPQPFTPEYWTCGVALNREEEPEEGAQETLLR